MKKKFIAKKTKPKKRRLKILFFFVIFFLSFLLTIKFLAKISLPTKNEELIRFLTENNNAFVIKTKSNYSYLHQIMTKLLDIDLTKPLTIINSNYKGLTKEKNKNKEETKKVSNLTPSISPTIYIYNTHDLEEYKSSSFAEYSVIPTVKLADYVLKEKLEDNGLGVLIEETSTASVRASLGLKYAGSYIASRTLLEQAKVNNPSLKYFIDLHRDSISYDRTTINYNNKNYAQILFIVGLENPNYQGNLDFTTKISDNLNSKIPGLSKGIYKKKGEGVNGVYNQDFSDRTILIELGGPYNTIEEVYETLLILSESLTEVITYDEK